MKMFMGNTVGLLFAAVLSACGGGGGSDGDGNVGTALEPLAIDDSNAMQVTAAVLDASSWFRRRKTNSAILQQNYMTGLVRI